MATAASSAQQDPTSVLLRHFKDVSKDRSNYTATCVGCGHVCKGAITRLRHHVLGGDSNIRLCRKPDAAIKDLVKDMEAKAAADRKRKADEEDLERERKKKTAAAQKTLTAGHGFTRKAGNDATHAAANMAVALAIIACGWAFHCVEHPSVLAMFAAVAAAGPTWTPPSRKDVSGRLLSDHVARVKDGVTPVSSQELCSFLISHFFVRFSQLLQHIAQFGRHLDLRWFHQCPTHGVD
jgi:hypothetical protein